MGSSPIGATQKLVDGQLLFLQGDRNADTGTPKSACFLPSLIAVKTVSVMSEAQFSSTLMSKGAGYSYPLVAKNAFSTTADIIQFAPIPEYYVFDAFEQDINAALVLERVMSDISVA